MKVLTADFSDDAGSKAKPGFEICVIGVICGSTCFSVFMGLV
jgi:hypothetical protein